MIRPRHFALLCSLMMLTLFVSAQAAPKLSSSEVLERHLEAKKKLQDMQAKVKLKLDLVLGILPYTETMTGLYYYKQPNKHKVKLHNPPAYLDEAPSLFNWKLPSLEKYNVKSGAPRKVGESTHYSLFYTPKNTGSSTRTIQCIFEAGNWRLIKQDTSYRDGGSVSLRFFYQDSSELPVLDKVDASVSIPSYKLTGEAKIQFHDQTTNQGLEDSIFQKAE